MLKRTFLLNFISLISKDRILRKHGFINGEIRIEITFRQIFKKPFYMCFYNCITGIFQVTKSIAQLKSGFWFRSFFYIIWLRSFLKY